MIEIDLKAGDIIVWENYPFFIKEFKPRRWFLYLGNDVIQNIVHLVTTTTQYQHYQQSGDRINNIYFELPEKMGGIEKKSILDIYSFETIPESEINKYKTDISKKGSLTQDYINSLVKHLKIDRRIQKTIKKDIYGYLRDAGFKVS